MPDDLFRFCDALGPSKIVHISNVKADLRGVVVIDNVAAGLAIGGTRMAPDVSTEECVRLARAMTLKNAAAGLPHGGAKSVIFGDAAMHRDKKEELIRAFACAIRTLDEYVPGPDMGTDEAAMAWIKDEIGRSVGLPREVGGIPLDEIGATGFGLAIAADVAQEFCDVKLQGAKFVVQGFGAVGKHAARHISSRGGILIAASDSRGTVLNDAGMDVDALIEHKATGASVSEFPGGKPADLDSLISVSCDIWIPAARPDVITAQSVDRLDCKLLLQGANIPATREAELMLHERGILSIPDFIANAGGVICASVEYHGGSQAAALATIEEKISFNTREVLKVAREQRVSPRESAIRLSEKRVRAAMELRRW